MLAFADIITNADGTATVRSSTLIETFNNKHLARLHLINKGYKFYYIPNYVQGWVLNRAVRGE